MFTNLVDHPFSLLIKMECHFNLNHRCARSACVSAFEVLRTTLLPDMQWSQSFRHTLLYTTDNNKSCPVLHLHLLSTNNIYCNLHWIPRPINLKLLQTVEWKEITHAFFGRWSDVNIDDRRFEPCLSMIRWAVLVLVKMKCTAYNLGFTDPIVSEYVTFPGMVFILRNSLFSDVFYFLTMSME